MSNSEILISRSFCLLKTRKSKKYILQEIAYSKIAFSKHTRTFSSKREKMVLLQMIIATVNKSI